MIPKIRIKPSRVRSMWNPSVATEVSSLNPLEKALTASIGTGGSSSYTTSCKKQSCVRPPPRKQANFRLSACNRDRGSHAITLSSAKVVLGTHLVAPLATM
eukprot:4399128-Pyramimonas_sp.AAC.1